MRDNVCSDGLPVPMTATVGIIILTPEFNAILPYATIKSRKAVASDCDMPPGALMERYMLTVCERDMVRFQAPFATQNCTNS